MTFNPTNLGAPKFKEISSEKDLIKFGRAAVAYYVSDYNADIDVSHISFGVSHRAKRRAAAMKSVNVDKLVGFTDTLLTEITDNKWEAIQEEHGDKLVEHDDFDHVKDVKLVWTWAAYEEFSREEWLKTIRHELAHVEQFHQTGDAGHSYDFKTRAEKFDTDDNCPQFVDYKYPFFCRSCGQQSGGRHRRSKSVRFAKKTVREQERVRENGETYWTTDCCDAFVTTKQE